MAPLLIFIMISSLAQFFVLLFYEGGFGSRVSWILLMFTMGSVALARLSIEQSREYSIGYAIALGIAAFVVMTGFVSNPIANLFILGLIGYLSDLIVHDCTLIDEDEDSSGQGLIDAGRVFVKQKKETYEKSKSPSGQLSGDSSGAENNSQSESDKRQVVTAKHQPGRTIFYLALAALPLFGFGQFFLQNDRAWASSLVYLAFYLFSSLSLLVTTSFLGLRRYLRQRNADMPKNVSVAWLAGGVGLIAIVLLIAYLAPLPGQALASFEAPKWLTSPDQSASSLGWGGEGADESDSDSAQTPDDPKPEGKQTQGTKDNKNSPGEKTLGDQNAANKDSKQAPPSEEQSDQGKPGQSGQSSSQSKSSEKQSDKTPPQKNSQSNSKNKSQQSSQQQQQQSQSKDQESQSQSKARGQKDSQSQSQAPKDAPSEKSSKSNDDEQSDAQQSDAQQSDARENENSDSKQDSRSKQDERSDREENERSEKNSDDRNDNGDADNKASENESDQQNKDAERERQDSSRADSATSSPPKEKPSSPPSMGSFFSGIVSLIKFLLFAVMLVIVLVFLWNNWAMIAAWWANLFGTTSPKQQSAIPVAERAPGVPPRPFSSFRNPFGVESDPRQIVVVTFQAFEAWMRERGSARERDETPDEFVRRIQSQPSTLSGPARRLADAYNRVVYGRGNAGEKDLEAAKQLWQTMAG